MNPRINFFIGLCLVAIALGGYINHLKEQQQNVTVNIRTVAIAVHSDENRPLQFQADGDGKSKLDFKFSFQLPKQERQVKEMTLHCPDKQNPHLDLCQNYYIKELSRMTHMQIISGTKNHDGYYFKRHHIKLPNINRYNRILSLMLVAICGLLCAEASLVLVSMVPSHKVHLVMVTGILSFAFCTIFLASTQLEEEISISRARIMETDFVVKNLTVNHHYASQPRPRKKILIGSDLVASWEENAQFRRFHNEIPPDIIVTSCTTGNATDYLLCLAQKWVEFENATVPVHFNMFGKPNIKSGHYNEGNLLEILNSSAIVLGAILILFMWFVSFQMIQKVKQQ